MADNYFAQFDNPQQPTAQQSPAQPPASVNYFAQFDTGGAPAAPMRTPGGLYHYITADGVERFSKEPPPAGSKPYVAPTAADVDSGDNFAAGVGKSFVDTGRGIGQLYDRIADAIAPRSPTLSGLVTGQQPSRLAASQAEAAEAQQRDAPLMATRAGTVGNLTGDVAQVAALPGAGLVGTGLRGAIAGGAVLGATRPTTDANQSALANTAEGAVGGAVGYGAGAALGRLAQPITNRLSNTAQAAVDELRARGVPMDLAQQTGSRVAGFFKQLAGTETSALPEQQSQAFTRAALKEIGEDATAADPSVMRAAKLRIGGAMDDVADRTPIKLDGPLSQRLATIRSEASDELSADQMTRVNKQIDNLLSHAANNSGEIPGAAYQTARSTLGRLSSNTQDASVGHWAGEVQDALDDALQRSASPQDLKTLLTARRQYRALKQIQGSIDENNQIRPARLWQSIDTAKNASQVIYGTGDQSLVRLAQAGMSVLKNARPEAPRQAAMNALLAHTGLGAITGGAEYAHSGSPLDALKYGVAGAVGSTALRAGATAAARLIAQNPAAANRLAAMGRSPLAAAVRQLLMQAGARVAGPAVAGALTVPQPPAAPTDATQQQQQ